MISKMDHRTPKWMVRSSRVAAGVVLGLMWLSPLPSQAATYTVLYSFTGKPNDGAFANGSLVQDDAGNLYGTTVGGGPYDLGTAFKVDTTGNETVLTKFDYANGGSPQPGLITHKGILYDTGDAGGYYGSGAVVKINDRGKVDLLYSFCSLAKCADGVFPQYGVSRDSAGYLYGTAEEGGAHGQGLVFKLDSGGHESVLYSFCPNGGTCSDGAFPVSGAIRDSAGNLYGAAQQGPNNLQACGNAPCGVIWKLDTSGHETVLHAFTGAPSDGAESYGLLAMDGIGSLYGTTVFGGNGTACQYGCGTVFKIDASGSETVLHSFTGGTDGSRPGDLALVLDKKGNLYGTAPDGGAYGHGVVFRLSTSGKLKILYSFHGQSDGGVPLAGLLLKQGVLYGETNTGGDLNCSESPGAGCGVVFKITL